MRSRRAWVLFGLLVLQNLALWVTAYVPGFGASGWHHVASLAAVLALCAALWRPLVRSRRFLAIGVLVLTVLAAASGFWLLYWKEGIRAAGYQDWGVFWHVAWSWAAAVFFFQHTWINRVAYAHFMRRSLATVGGRVVHVGGYALLVAAFFLTWAPLGRDWFTVESYIPLSLYAWLVATTPAYAVWVFGLVRRSRPRGLDGRRRFWRGSVDVALVPAAALAVLSGIPLTWFDPFLDANGWKYVSKYWHVWPSVLFTVLVFAHGVQTWRSMRIHWRTGGPRRLRAPGRGQRPLSE